jgi:hypothetical protein
MHFAEDARRHRGDNAAKAAPCASCYRGECDGEKKDFLCHLVSAFLSTPGKGNGYAATTPARLAANSLKYEDD